MSAPQSNPPQPAAEPVPEDTDESPLTDENFNAAKRSLITLVAGAVLGAGGVWAKTVLAIEPWSTVAIVVSLALLLAALILAFTAVAKGSSTPQVKKIRRYKFFVAWGFFSPVAAAALAGLLADSLMSVRYIATLVAVAIFIEVVIQALLKSDVKGHRRDALELASVVVGVTAAVWVLVGAFLAPS